MRRLSSLFFLATSLTLAACDSDPVETSTPPDLLPLAVGNQWVLEYTQTSLIGTRPPVMGMDTLQVIGVQQVDGEEWFEIEAFGGSSLVQSFRGFYANREDGVWKRASLNDSEGDGYLLYKAYGETGDTYTLPNENIDLTVTVLGVDKPLSSEAGVFQGNRYEFDATFGWNFPIAEGEARFERHLAPGVGFVSLASGFLGLEENEFVRRTSYEATLVSFDF